MLLTTSKNIDKLTYVYYNLDMEKFEYQPLQGPGYRVSVEVEASCECFGSEDDYSQTVEYTTATTPDGSTFAISAYEEVPSVMGITPNHGSDLDYATVTSVQPI